MPQQVLLFHPSTRWIIPVYSDFLYVEELRNTDQVFSTASIAATDDPSVIASGDEVASENAALNPVSNTVGTKGLGQANRGVS